MKLRYLRCDVGLQTFAFHLDDVRGLGRIDNVDRGHDGSPTVGLLRSAGHDVPVYRLGDLLGVEAELGRQVAVVDTGTEQIGLLVDRVSSVCEVPSERLFQLSTIHGDPRALFFHGVIRDDDGVSPLIVTERFGQSVARKSLPTTAVTFPQEFQTPAATVADRLVVVSSGTLLEDGQPLSFGFSLSQIVEVLDLPKVAPIPGSPEFVVGVAPWRDQVIPVVDWSVRLGCLAEGSPSTDGNSRSRLLVVRGPDEFGPVGVRVPLTMRVERLPLIHVPSQRKHDWNSSLIRNVVELRKETLILSDFLSALKTAV
jgi:chemotaxis signal transduction protein